MRKLLKHLYPIKFQCNLLKFYKRYLIEINSGAAFIGFIIVGFVMLSNSHKGQKWLVGMTKIAPLQSWFQLGAATSIAFAVAGPQIQHALGPRVEGGIQKARTVMCYPNAPIENLKALIQALRDYESYKRELVGYTRGRLYTLHLYFATINIFLLFWSSAIDPFGKIPNFPALLLCILCIIFPFLDLIVASLEANHIRPILQKAMNVCDGGNSTEIRTSCDAIRAEIKPFPTAI